MRLAFVGRVIVGLVIFGPDVAAQISSFPYVEHFDSIADSTLPADWTTSTNRRAGGDVFASLSSPHSSPHCLLSQNSIISQSLTSPRFDFSNQTPDKLQFYIARSSTHISGLLVEASIDDGTTFSIALSDTIKNPGTTSYILNTIQLPVSLANQSTVRIRWRLTGGTGGSTATFRIDDVGLTTLVTRDLAAMRLSVQPAQATSKDSLIFTVVVRNLGIQTTIGYNVNFFCDLNLNSVPEPNEHFATVTGFPIAIGDSVAYVAGHSPLKAGDYRIFAIVSLPQDERTSNDTISAMLNIGYPKGSMLVNEFMYAPAGDEPEWIELLNCSTDTVNLKNWRISDNNVSTKTLISTINIVIAPLGYCIVAKDANFAVAHPSVQCPIVIASFSALNNTTQDAIVLYEPRLLTIDSLFYSPSWGGQDGKSLERIDVDRPSTDASNWGQSQDSIGSSPARPNSIVRMANDLSIIGCSQALVQESSGLVPQITIVVRNVGKNSAASYSVILSSDLNHDNTSDPGEIITTINSNGPLHSSDSITYSYAWESVPEGESVVTASIEYPADQRLKNNHSSVIVRTNYSARSVIVNEIMFDPLPNQNEWIELYNRSHAPVDLNGWKFRDRPTASGSTNSFRIVTQSTILRIGEFALIAADSTIFDLFPYLAVRPAGCNVILLQASAGFGFNNDGDDIILQDLTGTQIDSVSYSSRWHRPDVTDTKGRSLERINPDLDSNSPANWTTSVLVTGGTPGKPNSTLTLGGVSVSSLTFSPNPFSPDGDGFEDFCIIQYTLPLGSAIIHVKVFDIKGRLVRELANSQISASHGDIIWDGLDQNRQRVRIGPYIVLIQAVDPNGNGTTTMKGIVVVAARL
jgi:hypothetical protein